MRNVRVYIRMYTCLYVRVYIYVHIYKYVYVYIYMRVCAYIYVYIHVHTYIHQYVCIWLYVCITLHTYPNSCFFSVLGFSRLGILAQGFKDLREAHAPAQLNSHPSGTCRSALSASAFARQIHDACSRRRARTIEAVSPAIDRQEACAVQGCQLR